MKAISGENIQSKCGISLSKLEHRDFEYRDYTNWIDIDKLGYESFDNPKLVYCNSSLINRDKPMLVESDLVEKLKHFKNPFNLILHNSDQNFDSVYKDILDIENCKKIFTQNINCVEPNIIPLPIGIGNSVWDYSNEDFLLDLTFNLPKKSEFIFFNFRIEGGVRGEYRPQCYEQVKQKGIPFLENRPYTEYLNELAKYKYIICPEGNGLDTHRLWEALYLKTIPIAKNNILNRHFSRYFPIVLVDEWKDLDIEYLETNYETLSNWKNYYLLDLDLFLKKINFYD